MFTPSIIIAVVVIILILWFVGLYNGLVKLRNNVKNSFADIDVQMKMRFDLVENLVNTVKGYASHEKETLTTLTDARTKFMHAHSPNGKLEADNMLSGALKSLFAVSENYPDLKANQNFIQLQSELANIEQSIAAARRYYNSSINEYNTMTEAFPSSIIAGAFGFGPEQSYKIEDEAEKAVPKVEF
jgi:LemA protein